MATIDASLLGHIITFHLHKPVCCCYQAKGHIARRLSESCEGLWPFTRSVFKLRMRMGELFRWKEQACSGNTSDAVQIVLTEYPEVLAL